MSSDTSSTSFTTPLLRPRQPSSNASGPSALSLFLSRAASATQRRGGASMLVRETAARELEERRADWGYSKPVVALDIMWNLAFVIVTVVMLICTIKENPNVPIRVWVCGYALQCLVHVVLVWIAYKGRNLRQQRNRARGQGAEEENQSENEEEDDGERGGLFGTSSSSRSLILFCRLAVVFLAFDVIFAIFCVVLACLIGIALCCCLPCIIAILYAIAGQEGASEADLSTLPKYRYQTCKDEDRVGFAAGRMIPIETSSGYMSIERILLPEDAVSALIQECCICLSGYEDGTELHALPCNHHFHLTCIVKWLKMNATCPLCKYNIVKGNEQV
ncbi:hypothetical protein CDL12_15225 [Handroanthus impetiginosus]|uniref:RING-type E3 ubiquitin transferase n=1 Tax=Handroanthus impetiginosus TaxID=429701 RepID=A0A2G9H3T6_9LAMI|nr:hypothetical protein CDL12_15225 [Handroanthus impetiginosus]